MHVHDAGICGRSIAADAEAAEAADAEAEEAAEALGQEAAMLLAEVTVRSQNKIGQSASECADGC